MQQSRSLEDPTSWLGSTALLDLDDPKLRLKAQSLTQLCQTPRDKALAIYAFVKRLCLAKPYKMRYRTAREVMEAGEGDADCKATLLVGLMRAAGIPARLRYVELRGEMLQGLVNNIPRAGRPLAEVWLGRWVRTDTYIFDAGYMSAARQRLQEQGDEWGYGIHVRGHAVWNGSDDAFLGNFPTEEDPMVLRAMPPVSDPDELSREPAWRTDYRLVTRHLHWNVVAPGMRKAIRELREEALRPSARTAEPAVLSPSARSAAAHSPRWQDR
ncbi:MAG: transglutaminase domain-containing protein [Burkholderiales bacterium]|nr:transglutaminase domain-containing protein [Burkholderiales bacterium]